MRNAIEIGLALLLVLSLAAAPACKKQAGEDAGKKAETAAEQSALIRRDSPRLKAAPARQPGHALYTDMVFRTMASRRLLSSRSRPTALSSILTNL